MLNFAANRWSSLVALIACATLVGGDTFGPIFQQQDLATVRRLTAGEVQRSLNQSVDPCRDFYEFACGGGGDSPDSPPIIKLRQLVDSTLHEFLTEVAAKGDSVANLKIKTFYQTCLAAERNGPQQQDFFAAVVQNNSGFPAVPGANWPNAHLYNWQDVIAHLHYAYDLNILLGIDVGENRRFPNLRSFYFTQPPTTIPAHLCHREATTRWNTSDKVYKPIVEEVAENLRGWLSLGRPDAERVARSLVDFEFELCSGMQPADLAGQQKNISVHSLLSFEYMFERKIDFPSLMRKSFGQEFPSPVNMESESYLRHLLQVLAQHNSTTVANYIMYRTLEQLSLPRHGDRRLYCMGLVKLHFPKLLDALYRSKFASDAVERHIDEMYDRLKGIFNRTSLHAEWFVDGDRGKLRFDDVRLQFAQHEAENVAQLEIGARNYWHNLANVLKFSRQQKLDLVLGRRNASVGTEVRSYDVLVRGRWDRRSVEIGWGVLQPPLHNRHYPNSMTYAMLGQLLANELVRLFDDILWESYARQRQEWHPDTMLAYGERSECSRRQVSNYLFNNPRRYRNESAVRDFVVRSGGLNVAFAAYLDWLHYLDPNNDFTTLSKETLPGVNYSNTQLFFIAFAQMGCRRPAESQRSAKMRAAPLLNPRENHSVERYAVNGPLMNSIEFVSEFRCPLGSPMNPVDKCVVY